MFENERKVSGKTEQLQKDPSICLKQQRSEFLKVEFLNEKLKNVFLKCLRHHFCWFESDWFCLTELNLLHVSPQFPHHYSMNTPVHTCHSFYLSLRPAHLLHLLHPFHFSSSSAVVFYLLMCCTVYFQSCLFIINVNFVCWDTFITWTTVFRD